MYVSYMVLQYFVLLLIGIWFGPAESDPLFRCSPENPAKGAVPPPHNLRIRTSSARDGSSRRAPTPSRSTRPINHLVAPPKDVIWSFVTKTHLYDIFVNIRVIGLIHAKYVAKRSYQPTG